MATLILALPYVKHFTLTDGVQMECTLYPLFSVRHTEHGRGWSPGYTCIQNFTAKPHAIGPAVLASYRKQLLLTCKAGLSVKITPDIFLRPDRFVLPLPEYYAVNAIFFFSLYFLLPVKDDR